MNASSFAPNQGSSRPGFQVTPLNPLLAPDAARLIVEVFRQEGITAYWLNLSGDTARRHYAKLIEAKLRLYLFTKQPVLTAMGNDQLVGVAVVKVGHLSPNLGQAIKLALPIIPRLLALAPRVRWQALSVSRLANLAMKPPDNLPKPHQLLDTLAVRSDCQGQGIGSLLLKAVHELARQSELPIYLITGDARNRDIYEHLGYRTVEVKQAPGLTVFHMVRQSE